MSITHQLCSNTSTKDDDSLLFSHQQSILNNKNNCVNNQQQLSLTYKQCFQIIIPEHEQWLQSTIMRQQLRHEQNNDYARTNNTKVKDVIIAYLSDNSADLLLSVLACMNLTLAISVSEVSILPAMINGRWTPKEMERALRPSIIRNEETNDIHTTVLLYGVGYEEAAREAVRLMNEANKHLY